MNDISFEESLRLHRALYIDVRAPVEYNEDHIPGAVNLPIFNDEERKEIGTLYKTAGRTDAVKRGTEIGGRRISEIINSIADIQDRDIIIYCARGGMRSGAVASFVNSLGIRTLRLIDGYRSYRRIVMKYLETVKIKPQIFVLQGLTGAGKTEIIREIETSIDLEDMAGHRSSLFGGIGLRQNSQKKFESLLFQKLNQFENADFIIIEGESKKIGNLHIPENIFSQMRDGKAVYIETPLERRVEIIKKEYSGLENREQLLEIIYSLRSKLGKEKTDLLAELYNSGKIEEFISILLTDYYDSLYRHTLDRFEYIAKISNFDSVRAADEVIKTATLHSDLK